MVHKQTSSSAGSARRALLITRDLEPGELEWADIAASAEQGLHLWRQRRHAQVVADFGRLPCGTTGTRLARHLRAEDPSVLLFLLSSQVHPTQAHWARRNGAFAVVPRSRESIAACLSGWTLQACTSTRANGRPLDAAMQAARRSLVSAMLSVGRMNPETLSVVENALTTLQGGGWQAQHGAPNALARTIAKRMLPQDLRATLLPWVAAAETPAAPALWH
jgi:DNA-binding NarL/FixJ family response regulator